MYFSRVKKPQSTLTGRVGERCWRVGTIKENQVSIQSVIDESMGCESLSFHVDDEIIPTTINAMSKVVNEIIAFVDPVKLEVFCSYVQLSIKVNPNCTRLSLTRCSSVEITPNQEFELLELYDCFYKGPIRCKQLNLVYEWYYSEENIVVDLKDFPGVTTVFMHFTEGVKFIPSPLGDIEYFAIFTDESIQEELAEMIKTSSKLKGFGCNWGLDELMPLIQTKKSITHLHSDCMSIDDEELVDAGGNIYPRWEHYVRRYAS